MVDVPNAIDVTRVLLWAMPLSPDNDLTLQYYAPQFIRGYFWKDASWEQRDGEAFQLKFCSNLRDSFWDAASFFELIGRFRKLLVIQYAYGRRNDYSA